MPTINKSHEVLKITSLRSLFRFDFVREKVLTLRTIERLVQFIKTVRFIKKKLGRDLDYICAFLRNNSRLFVRVGSNRDYAKRVNIVRSLYFHLLCGIIKF